MTDRSRALLALSSPPLELPQRRFVNIFAKSFSDSSLLNEFLVCFWHEEATREEEGNTLASAGSFSLSILPPQHVRQIRYVNIFAKSAFESSLLSEFLVCFWHEKATRGEGDTLSSRASPLSLSFLPLPRKLQYLYKYPLPLPLSLLVPPQACVVNPQT